MRESECVCVQERGRVCIANLLWVGSLGQAASIQHEGPLKVIEAFWCCLHAFYLCVVCGNFRFSLKLRCSALFSFDSFIGGIYSHLLHLWATAVYSFVRLRKCSCLIIHVFYMCVLFWIEIFGWFSCYIALNQASLQSCPKGACTQLFLWIHNSLLAKNYTEMWK